MTVAGERGRGQTPGASCGEARSAVRRGSPCRAGAADRCASHSNTKNRRRASTPCSRQKNFSITQQRQAIYDTPEYQAQAGRTGREETAKEATLEQVNDPERNFSGDLCYEGENGCAGDVRLYKWGNRTGTGAFRKVLFTARNGRD